MILAPPGPHVVFNSIPFGPSSGDGRYQQVYSSSLFSGPVGITALAFSPSTTGLYQADVTVRLGTTTMPVGGLSSTLDDNVTSPLTAVFTDPLFSQAVTGGSETFSLVFDFSATPFNYDPAGGENLLLDILISNKVYSGFGFSRADPNAFSSRAFDTTVFPGTADGLALRTQITFGPPASTVPEPSSLILLGLGSLGLFGYRLRWKRTRFANGQTA
jgi:hypothetical protein